MPSLLDVATHSTPDRRHSTDNLKPVTNPSRNSSTTSVTSHKSEPGWMTSMKAVDHNRANSVPQSSSKSSSGFGRFFGKSKGDKPKKEKKDIDQIILTSRHAAAVKTKLALDPKYKNAVRKDSSSTPQVVGTHNSPMFVSAEQQELRHPHSGPPAMFAPADKLEMPVLTRITSGDEQDEQDEWERMRQDWKQRKVPGVEMVQVIEGEAVGGDSSETTSPREQEGGQIEIPPSKVLERDGVRLLSVTDISLTGEEFQPRPERHHTPIGGRWKKNENGVWKR